MDALGSELSGKPKSYRDGQCDHAGDDKDHARLPPGRLLTLWCHLAEVGKRHRPRTGEKRRGTCLDHIAAFTREAGRFEEI